MEVSLLDPSDIYYLVRVEFFGFLRRVGMQYYGREGLLDRLEQQLEWGERNKRPLLAMLYFWWLYTSVPELTRAVELVERHARPWIHDATLGRIRNFARKCIWDLRWCAFLPENINAVLERLRSCLIVGIVMLNGHVLNIPEPDPRCFIKGEDVTLKMFETPQMVTQVQQLKQRAQKLEQVCRQLSGVDRTQFRWPAPRPPANQQKRVRFSMEPNRAPIEKFPEVVEAVSTLEKHLEPWLSWLSPVTE